MRLCPGTGQPVAYTTADVHPRCSACGADLSTQGKHRRVLTIVRDRRATLIARKHFVLRAAA